MFPAKLLVGLTVIVVVPVPVTKPPVTSIVSTVLSSDVFLMVILPVSTSTASSKVKTMFEPTVTPVASSVGVDDDKLGAVESSTAKVTEEDVYVMLPA